MTRVRVRWAAGAGRDPTPPNKYITHNVFLLEGAERYCAWQPTRSAVAMATDRHTHKCAQFVATRDAAAQSYTMVAGILRLIVGR